jgi:peptide/nickel transport system substrate-binding protein
MTKKRLSSITRRAALCGGAAILAAPTISRAQNERVLKFVPQADLTTLDPIFNTTAVTNNHAGLIFDSLYGLDAKYQPHPQMVEGHTVENNGLLWTMKLREGLCFHDGEPVLARDALASVRRWASRDVYGQEVLARSDEISAPDDRTLQFRLKRPFPNLPAALGKTGTPICAIMPERLAKTEGTKQVSEMVGSGPYRFLADERMAGARVAYARFEKYVPRPGGVLSRSAGAKIAHFDRVEWTVIPDQATAAAALMAGEVDWVDVTNNDLAPMMKRNRAIKVRHFQDSNVAIMRFNWLQPPFDKPAIRRAILGAVNQEDFMIAAYGTDPAAWRTGVGYFNSDSPMASKEGLEALTGPRDLAKVKRDLVAAGYTGERVVVLQPDDYPTLKAFAEVATDLLKQVGMNVHVQNADWGSISTRRANRGPLDQGGWSVFLTGVDITLDPGEHRPLRANGARAWFGWPDSPKLEALRSQWLDTTDIAAQKAICAQIQRQAIEDVPYIPLGEYFTLTAHKADLTGFSPGPPLFYGVRRV